MRSDMAKVIVERPRHGSSERGRPHKGYRRQRQRLGLDHVRQEGMKRPYGGLTKSLNEHLGPLNRYLNSQVGRPWNQVFSEICAHVRRDSAVQDHVRDHVADFVTTNVVLIDGVACHGGGGRFGGRTYGLPLRGGHTHQQFYVCPLTGLLRRVPPSESKRQRTARQQNRPTESPVIPFGKHRRLRFIDGAWCEVLLRSFRPQDDASPVPDVLLGRSLRRDWAVAVHGCQAYAVSVRRLDRDELHSLPIPIDLLRGRRELPEVVR
jgi:hypothetical protein